MLSAHANPTLINILKYTKKLLLMRVLMRKCARRENFYNTSTYVALIKKLTYQKIVLNRIQCPSANKSLLYGW